MSVEVRARLHGQQVANDPLGDGSAVYDSVSPAVEVSHVETKALTGQRALFNSDPAATRTEAYDLLM